MQILEKNLLENVTELEKDTIANYLVKESLEIAIEEIDYFIQTKNSLLEVLVDSVDFKKFNEAIVLDKFNKIIYSSTDVAKVLERIEKRVNKEISRTQSSAIIKLEEINITIDREFLSFKEELRTLRLSETMNTNINKLWKQTSTKLLPKEIKKYGAKYTSKLNVGEYFLASVGVSPKEIKAGMKDKLLRRLKGIVKQNRIDLINLTKKEILAQIYSSFALDTQMAIQEVEIAKIKSA